MQTLAPITLTAGQSTPITFDADSVGMIIVNESQMALLIDMQGYTRWIPAWVEDFIPFQSMLRTSGTLKITPTNISNNSNPPSANALVTLVKSGDTVTGVYPNALTRQVASNVTASSAYDLLSADNTRFFYVDDTSFANTLDITPAVAPVNDNSKLDVGLAAKLGGDTTTYRRVLASDVANNALQLYAALKLNINTGQSLSGYQVLSGTGTTTVSHSLGVTPAIAIITCTNALTTYDVSNYTATNVTVNIGVGDSWKLLLLV